ncbi:adenosylcobinamide-GDP ribazoletransferase [Nonomuraea longispora]|uniref:Adenosylcobinamide-GDP ribazoletransferase n=1 Tax=Nonomuraea longispora TaxID=1848320 RepID=A0A4R4MU83_9ACTN|nr:adenosylcobinamide-GDP ribazoletransferase [Nonomuraea longispora]TDB99617.1 adenosylcobinamide-GDP ribazoletransferase [Nonomuraea longispora]
MRGFAKVGRQADGWRFSAGTLTVFPVRVERADRKVAGQAMVLAPAVGLMLGLVAGLPLPLVALLHGPPLLGAALAVGALAVLTRGLHLDGLADLADGLGSGKPAAQALDIMKKSDIGPFGVMTLVLTLLIQAAAAAGAGYAAFVTACAAGRLALVWACRAGVPAARPDGLGAMVAGTVRPPAPWLVTAAALLAAAALGLAAFLAGADSLTVVDSLTGAATAAGPAAGPAAPGTGIGTAGVLVLPAGLLAGLGAALLLLRHAGRRLGGITGDVLGALVETATATTLVVCALLG